MKKLSQFESLGNIELLSQNILALYSSKNTPQELYLDIFDLFDALVELPISLAGGWQAPVEKKLLTRINSNHKANIIYYSAKDLSKQNKDKQLDILTGNNKILFVSAQSRKNRVSKNDVLKRDELLFSHVNKILFLYIEQGGRLHNYFENLINHNYSVFVFDHEINKDFLKADGCLGLNKDNFDLLK